MGKYFAYDDDGGFDWYETLEEARSAAQRRLEWYRKRAGDDGEWYDEVGSLCYGQILGDVVEVPVEDGDVDMKLRGLAE